MTLIAGCCFAGWLEAGGESRSEKNMKNQIVHETFQNESYDFFDFFWIDNEILRRMDLSKLKMDIWWKIVIFHHILG